MIAKKVVVAIIFLVLLTGCSIDQGICIDGSNLTYDGEKASGRIRIVSCDQPSQTIRQVDISNETIEGVVQQASASHINMLTTMDEEKANE